MNFNEFDANKHKFLGKIDYPVLTWDEVIFNFNENIVSDGFVTILDNYGLVTHDAEKIKKVNDVSPLFQQLFPNNYISAHLYVSLTQISKTFGKHNDDVPVFFWQCIGITRWTVYEDISYVYDLMPGELLYIPKEVYHNTQPITPRAGVSFGIELK
jgi:ribosomal protein L16 Arg81 hydroxylase